VLTPDALEFLGRLHREVEPTRLERLAWRVEVAERLRNGGTFHFLSGTADVRQKDWRVAECRRISVFGRSRSPDRPIARCDQRTELWSLGLHGRLRDANTPTWPTWSKVSATLSMR